MLTTGTPRLRCCGPCDRSPDGRDRQHSCGPCSSQAPEQLL